jgi:Mg-chelatase subunit ChlD
MQAEQRKPPELLKAVEEVRARLRVPPPRFEVRVDSKAPTFSSSYIDKEITVPGYWREFSSEHLHGFLGHEHKHCTVDGYPGSYIEGKRCQAVLMAAYGLQAEEAHRALNALFDAIINTRLHEEGFAIREALNVWVKRFPFTEGTVYHVLQMLHKRLIGTAIPPSGFESQVEYRPEFEELLRCVRELVRDGDRMQERKNADTVAKAAYYLYSMAAVKDASEGECRDGGEPVPEDQRAKVAEIAQQAGLNATQLKDLLGDPGVSVDEARELLAEAAKGIARTEIWRSLRGFESASSGSGRSVAEPYARKWRGHDVSKLEPLSVALHKDDPARWREKAKRPFVTVEQPSSDSGFEEVVVLLDRSGSTERIYGGRTVLSYEKDAAISAVGFARKENGIPVSLIWFDSDARVEVARGKHHMRIAEEIAAMRPGGGTNLGSAIRECVRLNPKRALIAIVTDGEVAQGSFSPILKISGQNRVVCAVVSPEIEKNTLVSDASGKATIIHVAPDQAGRTAMKLLKTFVK